MNKEEIIKIRKKIINDVNQPSIQSILKEIELSEYRFNKDEILELFKFFHRQLEGIYTTSNSIAELIDIIGKFYDANSVIDICAGTGNILYYFKNCKKIVGIDINESIMQLATKIIPNAELISADTLQHNFGETKFDLVTGNLPFGMKINHKTYLEIELIKKGLSLLTKNGVAVFIIPEMILSSQTFTEFRKDLIANFAIDMIISLPLDTLYPSYIQSSVIVIRNGSANKDIFMPLFGGNAYMIVANFKEHKSDFYLPITKLENRLDRNYYQKLEIVQEKIKDKETKKLSEFATLIAGKSLDKSSFSDKGRYWVFNRENTFIDDVRDENRILKPNDIVISVLNFKSDLYVHTSKDKEIVIPENYVIIRSSNNPYILSYLQTKEGQEFFKQQKELHTNGHIMPKINLLSLENILIPILPLSDLNIIANKQILPQYTQEFKELSNSYDKDSPHYKLIQEMLREMRQEILGEMGEMMTQHKITHSKLDSVEKYTKLIPDVKEVVDRIENKIGIVVSNLKDHSKKFTTFKEVSEKSNRDLYKFLDDYLLKDVGEDILAYVDLVVKEWNWAKSDFRKLSNNGQIFLVNAHFLSKALLKVNTFDSSPAILQYIRVIEYELTERMIKPLAKIRNITDYGVYLERCKNQAEISGSTKDTNNIYFLAQIPQKEEKDITFGTISQTIEYLNNSNIQSEIIVTEIKTILRTDVFFDFDKFFGFTIDKTSINYKSLKPTKNIELKGHQAKTDCSLKGIFTTLHKYRNLAAHQGKLDEVDLYNCKILVQEILKVCILSLKLK